MSEPNQAREHSRRRAVCGGLSSARVLGVLAALLLATPTVQAHIFHFIALLNGQTVLPPVQTPVTGTAVFQYNHHGLLFDIDLFIEGLTLADLANTGPNNTPVHIHTAPLGANGPIVLDLGWMTQFVEEPTGLRLILNDAFLGDQQGNVWSDFFQNEVDLFDEKLYIDVHTIAHPEGEVRGQLVVSGIGLCPADYNNDGVVDVLDFFIFVNLFSQNSFEADLNLDGTVDVLDFFRFIAVFQVGC